MIRRRMLGRRLPAIAPDAAAPSAKSSVPNVVQIRNMPSMKPKSPMRLTTNAFFAAAAALGLLEPEADQQIAAQARPPSQNTNSSRKLPASTSMHIENTNSEMHAKNRG